jgi:hypothetical protein
MKGWAKAGVLELADSSFAIASDHAYRHVTLVIPGRGAIGSLHPIALLRDPVRKKSRLAVAGLAVAGLAVAVADRTRRENGNGVPLLHQRHSGVLFLH